VSKRDNVRIMVRAVITRSIVIGTFLLPILLAACDGGDGGGGGGPGSGY
jgi:hypothetical protein